MEHRDRTAVLQEFRSRNQLSYEWNLAFVQTSA